MAVDRDRQGGDPSFLDLGQGGRIAAVDDADRQVPQQVDHARTGDSLDERAQALAQARQAGDRGEEGKERFGSQRVLRVSVSRQSG
ncbi:hypothetical protein STHU_32560 [Allostella humosa]|nr:hypothetical protein STHU_32560 [Stella humosa]